LRRRHPMLADVDDATRVDVHMPWSGSDRGCSKAQRAPKRAHCSAALHGCQSGAAPDRCESYCASGLNTTLGRPCSGAVSQ
jgi:hypothetical protein